MSTSGRLGVKGMNTAGNEFTLPPGTLTGATGVVLPASGVLATARGMALSTYVDNDATNANSNSPKEIWQWGPNLFINYTGSAGYKLALWKNWATAPVYALLGSYAPPAPTTLRMKFAALARSAFWTTDAGLYTLDSATGTARAAGLRPPIPIMDDSDGGLGTRLSGNPSATGTWMTKDRAVAYHATIGLKDANGVVVESQASDRVVVINPADVTVAIGGLVRNANVVTATVASHKFRVGDVLDLVVTGGDVGNFDTTNNVVTAVTATTIVWAETAANYINVASVTITSGTKSVQVTVLLRADGTAGRFVRLYRTDEAASQSIDPGDECFLSYERAITATDVSNGYIIITDTTPADFLSDPLDSNANSGEGQLGVNERPPLCRDLCAWDGRLWGGQTTDFHRLRLRLLGVGSPNGIQTNDLLAVNVRVYTFSAASNLIITSQYLPTENVNRTATYMSYVIGGVATNHGLLASMQYDGDTGLGEVVVQQDVVGSTLADGASGAINAIYAATSRATAWGDAMAATKAVTSANTSRTGSTVTVRCASHGFAQGQVIMLAYDVNSAVDANFALGLKTIATITDANNFTYTEAGSAVTLSGGSTYYAYATTYKSDANPQIVRFTRPGLPNAWPVPNSLSGFPDGAEVLRIKPTPDGGELLVCLKDGDTYAVSGQYPYSVRRVDGTASLVFADTLVEHAGRLYGVTTQGICSIGSIGVGLTGLDIQDTVRAVVSLFLQAGYNTSIPYAVSYESERQCHFALPQVSVPSSNVGRYVLHSLTNEYTMITQAASECALVWRGGDYLVEGTSTVQSNQLRVERKSYNTDGRDFAGRQFALAVVGAQAGVSSIVIASPTVAPAAGDAVLIGASNYRVTGYAVTGAPPAPTLSIDGTVTVTNGQALTHYVRASSTVTLALEAAGVPGIEKQFRELQLHLGKSLFRQMSLVFSSNNSTSSSASLTVSPSDYAINSALHFGRPSMRRVEIPQSMRQAAWIRVIITLDEAFSYYELLGYSVTYEPISERVGK